jgi:hypothetical protein
MFSVLDVLEVINFPTYVREALVSVPDATPVDMIENLEAMKERCKNLKPQLESAAERVRAAEMNKERRGVLLRGLTRAMGAVEGMVTAIERALIETAERVEQRARSLIMPVSLAMAYSTKTGWNWTDNLDERGERLNVPLWTKVFMRWADHEARSALNAPAVTVAVSAALKTKTAAQSLDTGSDVVAPLKTALTALLPENCTIEGTSVTRWRVYAPAVRDGCESKYAPNPSTSTCVAMYTVKLTYGSACINLDVTCVEIEGSVHIHTVAPNSGYHEKRLLDTTAYPDEPWGAVRSLIDGPPQPSVFRTARTSFPRPNPPRRAASSRPLRRRWISSCCARDTL